MEKPLVSVIIICYKNFSSIYQALDSVFIQRYPSIEIIIQDDGSPDYNQHRNRIAQYIDSRKRDNIVSVVLNHLERNAGTSKNCNAGIALASGKYMKLLTPDDQLYDENVLEKCVACAEERQARIVVGQTFVKRRGSEEIDEVKETAGYRWTARSGRRCNLTPSTRDILYLGRLEKKKCNQILMSRCIISTISVFYRMDLLRETGGFLETYRLIEDMTYWPHLAARGERFCFAEIIMTRYALNGVSNGDALNQEFLRDYMELMKDIYIANEKRGGWLNPMLRRLRTRQIQWMGIASKGASGPARLRYLDVLLYEFLRNIKYLLTGSKL